MIALGETFQLSYVSMHVMQLGIHTLHTLLLMLKTRINHAEYDVITRPVHDATYLGCPTGPSIDAHVLMAASADPRTNGPAFKPNSFVRLLLHH